MCFSAPVSFAASAFIATAGVMALRETTLKSERPFASVPLLFAIQQFIEGCLWVLLPQAGTGAATHALTQGYAVFIGVIWPVIIPLSILLIEPDLIRKRLMQVVLLLGVAVAAFTLMIILKYGVAVQMVNQCLVYTNPVGGGFWIRSAYVVATCAAFFISSHVSVRVIGMAMVVGFAVAFSFFRLNYPSVWCFFAALVSGLTYWHFRRKKTGDVKETLTV
ncbi:hypothetical protein Q1W73_04990 [Asticcacaulis sp. ZE23SCel15]|uniref:DUF6629 family protein n=1 Tax=Asticcacaulis sp. ZE23SCel15 TaxID=3059027 RepID=UPI00265FD5D7|nr:DUF6629 family protein [Asticcacaulis sp. ZE23SCel15]WKL58340.1 hypothetical protein Q1W73_04990 [Asticcacaulis sp. ZE23SCel15]